MRQNNQTGKLNRKTPGTRRLARVRAGMLAAVIVLTTLIAPAPAVLALDLDTEDKETGILMDNEEQKAEETSEETIMEEETAEATITEAENSEKTLSEAETAEEDLSETEAESQDKPYDEDGESETASVEATPVENENTGDEEEMTEPGEETDAETSAEDRAEEIPEETTASEAEETAEEAEERKEEISEEAEENKEESAEEHAENEEEPTEESVEESVEETAENEEETVEEETSYLSGTFEFVKEGDYTVSVTVDEEAMIPSGAELLVTELYGEEYEEYCRMAAEALEEESFANARFFDIRFEYAGEEIEPAGPVQVAIRYFETIRDEEEADKSKDTTVLHFTEEDVEILEKENDPEDDGICFTTESFSVFGFVRANYTGSLDGQEFAIVRDNGTNLAALLSERYAGPEVRLAGAWVNVLEDGKLTAVTEANGFTEEETDITVWTFEHVRGNLYRVRSGENYLSIEKTGVSVEAEPGLIEVIPLLSGAETNGKVRLRQEGYYINLKGGNARSGFQARNTADANCSFSLYAAESLKTAAPEKVRKLSASALQAAQNVVIYQRVWSEQAEAYEFYVADGNGSLVYAWDEGDTISYRSEVSAEWYVIEHIDENTGLPSGYYDFYNRETGKYLAPSHDGILSDSMTGVILSGKEAGEFNTTIEAWDGSCWAYCGFCCDVEKRVLLSATGSDSSEFSFAVPEEDYRSELHEVETVDSSARGIRISMYDFSSRNEMNVFGDDTFYKDGSFRQGLVRKVLGADGFPVSASGVSFSSIYNEDSFTGEGNNLFLQSVLGTSGYYEFSSFTNFAAYDRESGKFTVYDQQGTPSNGVGGSNSSYSRGNYLPYNMIDTGRKAGNTKLYDTGWDLVSMEDPSFEGTLYMTDKPNYFFGTVIEAGFLQAKGGLDQSGNPIVYEFHGDDDLWVYIDGVLVLDIGGIHSAVSGTIDFSTGEVAAGSGAYQVKTTIRAAFKAAGIFPDGRMWDESLADGYFTGETFSDYSGHTMKMFYQERGAGASTLQVRFNLPVVQSGAFAVEKVLGGTSQQNYTSVQFAFQAFLQTGCGDVALYPGLILDADGNVVPEEQASEAQKEHAVKAVYESTGSQVDFYYGTEIGGRTYDGVFYLKPTEAAVFTGIPENIPYYVKELDVSGAFYDTVMINEADMGGEAGISEDSAIAAVSSAATIQQRQRVIFRNMCSDANMRDLRITKKVENAADDRTGFEFRIMLEGSDGKLTYYSRGEYCVTKEIDGAEHYFCFEDGELADMGTEPVVCSVSGRYGTIAGIPDGYTVVIRNLLAGTDFLVEEIRIPKGYIQVGKDVNEESCDPADLEGADGKIRLRANAEVLITNRRFSTITAEKVWEDEGKVALHGTVWTALFEITEDGEVLVEKGNVLKNDSIQEIIAPEETAVWYLDLPEGGDLQNYAVREVSLEAGEDGENTVLPLKEGMIITVKDETLEDGETQDQRYEVLSYETGSAKTAEGCGKNSGDGVIYDRTDRVTNRLTEGFTLSFVKVDAANTEHVLSGAEFRLEKVTETAGEAQDAGNAGEDAGTMNFEDAEIPAGAYAAETVYECLVSDSEGRLTLMEEENSTAEFFLSYGTYRLVETKAPAGYDRKEDPVMITVSADGVSYDEGTDLSADGEGISISEETGVYTLLISNARGIELPHTGGAGRRWINVMGGSIFAAAVILLMIRFRLRRAALCDKI